MDVYTTSFTYPRRSRHAHSAPSSLEFPGAEIRLSSVDSYSAAHHLQQHVNTSISDSAPQPDAEAIQKLAMMAMSLHGCHISYFQADPGRWNFYITGAYQQVMVARGMILKECPIQVCRRRKVAFSSTQCADVL